MSKAYKCPNCNHTIRATNVEWWYDNGDEDGDVIKSPYVAFSEYSHTDDKEQLHYCPNENCRIVRLLPGDSDE